MMREASRSLRRISDESTPVGYCQGAQWAIPVTTEAHLCCEHRVA